MSTKISAILLLLLLFNGCGGDSSSDEKSDDSNSKGVAQGTGDTQGGANTPGGAGDTSNRPQRGTPSGGSGFRSASLFGGMSDSKDMNVLKQMALGMHNFHDTYRQFPLVPLTQNGVHEKLSWRVQLLPFLGDQQRKLFDSFDRNAPWDSPKNKANIAAGKGFYSLSNGSLVCAIKSANPPKGMRNIVDGTSNTIMFIENPNLQGDAWTQPKDISPEEAVKMVKSMKKGEYLLVALYDGSVRRIYSTEGKDLSDDDIRAPFDYRDGLLSNDELFQPGKTN